MLPCKELDTLNESAILNDLRKFWENAVERNEKTFGIFIQLTKTLFL